MSAARADRRIPDRHLRAAAGLLGLLLAVLSASAEEPKSLRDRTDEDFFESKVRPVLVEHCYRCHSSEAKKLKGGLRLDSSEGMRKGGDSGPAVVPGNPDESLLIRAVRHEDELTQMPPTRKLPDETIRALERWVKAGAAVALEHPAGPSPGTQARSSATDLAAARQHWAYQPVQRREPPPVKDPGWCRTPIDRFVLARLEAAGLTPSPIADRRTLLRRVTYDLIGLPPTIEQIEAFEQDRRPDAYERIVDGLLASPRYGERWGRHWLDVARYADTKDGVLMYGDDRVRPFAYTYRDYVIRALNEDTPFDRFVQEQIAADQLVPANQPWRLAAMGFLTLGRMFDNNIHDQIDDQIDTVSRGLLGLTVACARCHDHKYDAVSTADYYALYGVFASSEAPFELPLTEPLANRPGCAEFEKQAAAKRGELLAILDSQYATLTEAARIRVGDYLTRAALSEPDPLEAAIFFLSLAPEDLRPQIVARWRRYLKQHANADDPVFGPWRELMKLRDGDFTAEAIAVIAGLSARTAGTATGRLNPLVLDALRQGTLKSRADVPRVYGELIRQVYERNKKAGPAGSASGAGQSDRAVQQILEIVTGKDSPAYFPKSQTWAYMSRTEKDSFGGKQVELDRMAVKAAGNAVPRAMVLTDSEQPYEPRVFVRGNPAQPGEHVPRRFLHVLTGDNPAPFTHGSGRLDLARAITAPDNPLTSRVIVNRVWMHHFGEPLVSTPSDFGTRSTPPTHPELLDDMAAGLIQNGWTLKGLHRQIVLSSTYRQASFDRSEGHRLDPENRLLWKFNRRRLDLEAIRDTLLAISGRLEPVMAGRPVDVAGDPKTTRRTVYGLIDRQGVPSVFRAFDFASPDQSSERRPRTTVPQQALFSMNAPLVIEQVRAIASRSEITGAATPEARVEALFRLTLARRPDPVERDAACRFLKANLGNSDGDDKQSRLDRTQQLAQVLIMTNELFFVD